MRFHNRREFRRKQTQFSIQKHPIHTNKVSPSKVTAKQLYVSAVDSDLVSHFQDNLTAQIYLQQTPVTALLDSGARMSLIDYDLLHAVFPRASQHIFHSVSNFNSIIGVTGDSKNIEGCIYLNMIIGNIHCSQIFHVVKKLKPECLLGRDFLRQYKCVLDFTTHTLRSTKLAQLKWIQQL